MKVKQLIRKLSKLDPNLNVVMSKDGEGNDFSPLADLSIGFYIANSTWSGDFVNIDDDDYEGNKKKKTLALWPVN